MSDLAGDQAVATVAHAADRYHCYPGETVTLFSQIDVHERLDSLILTVSVPESLRIDSYELKPDTGGVGATLLVEDETSFVCWHIDEELPAGTCFECQIQTTTAPTMQDLWIESRAELGQDEVVVFSEETVCLAIRAKGSYLKYLPELYAQDEMMGRFLMLFESFWAPIQMQSRTTDAYLDPKMTVPRLLPWIASWVGLDLDEQMPEERQRRLIKKASSLFRRRGTKMALREYLEISTGGDVEIVEHRAQNFSLGTDSRLGPGVALGRDNHPHNFTVNVRLESLGALGDDERTRRELEQRRQIESIINAEKPAHARYDLQIEYTVSEERASGVER
jgi:phage tail-like protein